MAELDRTVLRGPTNHRRGVARGVIAYNLRVPYDTVRDWIEYRTR